MQNSLWRQIQNRPMPLTSSVMKQRVSNFRLYCCSKKFQMLWKNVKLLLEQLQVYIFAEIAFGVRCTLTSLNMSSWNEFWSKGTCKSSHFETFPSFQISWTWSDLFWINKNFIQQLSTVSPPYLLSKMTKIMRWVTKLYCGECSIIWQAFPTIRMSNSYIHLWKILILINNYSPKWR